MNETLLTSGIFDITGTTLVIGISIFFGMAIVGLMIKKTIDCGNSEENEFENCSDWEGDK